MYSKPMFMSYGRVFWVNGIEKGGRRTVVPARSQAAGIHKRRIFQPLSSCWCWCCCCDEVDLLGVAK